MKNYITLLITGLAASVGTMSHAANYTWTNGGSDMTWNTTSTNWNAGAGNTVWADNNNAILGATGAGAITVSGTQVITGLTVNSTGYSLTGGQVNLGSAATGFAINNDISIGSVIGGANGLTKTGTGNLTLSGANSYTGNTTVSAGRVILGDANALGTTAGSTTVSSGAAVDVKGLTLSENFTISGSGVSTSGAIYNSSTTTAVLNGTINANGSNFGGASDQGGYTIASLNALGSVTFNSGKNSTINGLSGAGALNKWNSGTLTLGGDNTGYTGTIAINSRTIQLANAGALGTAGNGTQLRRYDDNNRGTLDLNGFSIAETLSFEDSGTAGTSLGSGGFLTNNSTTAVTVSGTIALTKNGTIQGTGNITATNVISGTGSLTKNGTNTFTLSGNNTYTGSTQVNAGTLILGSADALAGSTLSTAGNGTVTYFAGTNNMGGISGNGSVSNGGNLLSIGANGQSTTYSGNMSGTGGLTKVGAGVLTLSGANTYTGATNVTSGTLLVNGNQAASTGAVATAAGATLGGTGTIGGVTTIAGILSPGAGGVGTLNITGNVTWQGASSNGTATDWIFQLGASNTADLLNITGNFLKDAVTYGSNFRFDFGGSANTGIFKLVVWSGTTSFSASDFTFTNLGEGLSGSFAINGSQLDFTAFSAIPEPSTWIGMAALALTGGAIVARRRRTKSLIGARR